MLDSLLRLNARKLLLIAGVWALCVVLHNLLYAVWRDFFHPDWDEPFFLLLAVVVIPLYLALSVGYTAVRHLRRDA